MKSLKKNLSLLLVLTVILTILSQVVYGTEPSTLPSGNEVSQIWDLKGYDEWLAEVSELEKPSEKARVELNGALLEEGKSVDVAVTVAQSGLYCLKIGYTAVTGDSLFSSPIELTVEVNGAVPYKEAAALNLSRVFETVDNEFKKDTSGNDIQPEIKEVTPEQEYILSDSSGYHSGGLYLPFNAGNNTVKLSSERSDIKLNYIEICPQEEEISYEQYLNENGKGDSENADPIKIEAEKIYRKSDCTIVPASDRSSSSVTPNSASSLLLNTVGSNFSKIGQWVSWKVDVKQSGYYKISLYAKQSVNSGSVSSRKIMIDGAVPFKEAEVIRFPFSESYENYTVSSEKEELLFYLSEGEHEIALEAVLGDMSEYLRRISSILSDLNEDYLKILFYTGSSPDIYRNYGFEKLIPDVLEDFEKKSDELEEISTGLKELSSGSGSSTVTLDKLADILNIMSQRTDKIAQNFSQFKETLSALGSWINEYTSQPLQIDSITLIPENHQIEGKKESFLKNLWFKFRIFLSSFTSDYDDESGDTKQINVWIATGRDQSKIIDKLSQNDAAKTGISAKVSLVSADALLPNVLAGSPIDIYLNAAVADPINYAIRGAVVDLTELEDFETVAERFHPSALIPFSYKGAVYALPESFDFPLMFYRKDIFDNLGIEIPETWDQFYEAVALLQKNNLTVGVTWTDMFNLMLYQSGGEYYNKEQNASVLDSFESIDAFAKTLKLYTDYNLPVEFSFANRFKSGDMPLGIVPYTMYNQLYLFAPEIEGLWGFTSVPGMKQADGSINNSVIASGTGAVMLRTTTDKQAAWDFLKWWTDTDTQINFGIEMEKVMGAAARQSSANLDVVKGFPWSAQEFKVISKQWENINTISQIPGSYYITRTLDFSFNSAYSLSEDSSRALIRNVKELNEEISRKIAEFEKTEE